MTDKNEYAGKLVFGYRTGRFYGIFTGNKNKILIFDEWDDWIGRRDDINVEEQRETEVFVSFGR